MTLMEVLADDNFISVNRSIVKVLGLECAVILGELCAEYTYYKNRNELKDDMFYCTVEKLKERTTLSKYQQLQAIEKLEKIGIVKTELHGVPATRYFRIDQSQLANFLTSDSCLKTDQLDVQKLDSSNTITSIQNNTNFTNVKLEQPTVTPQPKRRVKLVDTSNVPVNENTVNQEKPKKKNLYQNCVEQINDFSGENTKLRDKLMGFLNMRIELKNKPFGSKTFKGYLDKLEELSNDSEEQIKIIQQSIDRQYPTFYEVKKYNNYKRIGEQDPSVFSEYGKVKSEHRENEVVLNVSF